ncbi:MAG: NAD(P)H-dependent oxidoreductase [Solirubrobacteraceae bacterium]|nr:NAD(P)H-dependent oxidoreductase [Patulibacter sp.]
MSHLLHLDASLRTTESRSRTLSARFADGWRAAHPGGTVTYRDLSADPIPHLDEPAYSSLFVPAEERSAEQHAARAFGDPFIEELRAADTVVIGLPLQNFGPPSTFLAWLDRITAPSTIGALGDTRFVFATASGGAYGPGTPREGWDHREPLVRHVLEFLGATDVSFVNVELTLARVSPQMIPLDLGAEEDRSFQAGLDAIDALAASGSLVA